MIAFDCRLRRAAFTFEAAFEAGPGVTALFGPSGSGKSTALRLLAGLERPDSGRIAQDEAVLTDTGAGVMVPPHRRRMGLVFQDALLLPHLSVRANLLYGRFFTPKRERRIELGPVVEVLGIGHLLERRPATLSGGERQRVAIGRALLATPRLLLMDEPLASLDAARKAEILPFIERLRDAFRIPIVYVSHAVEEVARLASQVVRLEEGRVVETGAPSMVLASGRAGRQADQAGSIIFARVGEPIAAHGLTLLDHPAGTITVPGLFSAGREVSVFVRASDVTLAVGPTEGLSVRTRLSGVVTTVSAGDGPFALATVALHGGGMLAAALTRLSAEELGLAPGKAVTALVKAAAVDEGGLGLPGKAPERVQQDPGASQS